MLSEKDFGMTQIVDTVVIGGGVVGTCSAYYLAEQGRQVTLVDQAEIGLGCSYGNAGLVTPSHSIPLARPGMVAKGLKWMLNNESPFYVKPRFDFAMLSWLLHFAVACRSGPMQNGIPILRDLNRASLALHKQLATLDGMDSSLRQNGLIMLFKSAKGLKEGLWDAHQLNQHGISSEVLDYAAVRDMEPSVMSTVIGGVYFKDDAHLDPAKFVSRLAGLAEKHGVNVLTGVEVQGFEISGRRISAVKTTRGEIRADLVVLTAGAWTPRIAKSLHLKLPIQGAKGYSITVKSAPFCPSRPLILSEAKVAVTPMGPVLRFAGTLELGGFDFSINERRVRAILRAVRECLFANKQLELVETWCGLRPCTPDSLPIIGCSKSYKNLIIATGHGMLGVSAGPITGKLVSQLANGEVPDINLARLSPERFR